MHGPLIYLATGRPVRNSHPVRGARNARSARSACNARSARNVRSAPGARKAGNTLRVRSAHRATGARRITLCCNIICNYPAHSPKLLVRINVARARAPQNTQGYRRFAIA